jgi:hypothetical protein
MDWAIDLTLIRGAMGSSHGVSKRSIKNHLRRLEADLELGHKAPEIF